MVLFIYNKEHLCITMIDKRKFLQPSLKNVLSRPRLTSLLGEKRVILLLGRAGQGKATLCADFLGKNNYPSLWYGLDAGDTDPARFVSNLKSRISEEYGFPSHQSIPSPEKGGTNNSYTTAMDLVAALSTASVKPLFLILKGFHSIAGSTETCQILEILINNLPEQVHLCLISRCDFTIPLTDLRRRKELMELRDKDLTFTREETRELLTDVYDISLTGGEIDRIEEYAHGWTTPIVFMAERLSRLDTSQRNSFIAGLSETELLPEIEEFFQSEVLSGLEPAELHNLTLLGMAGTFTPELAERLIGESRETIAHFMHNNLFLEQTDYPEKTYFFHPLFTVFLRKLSTSLPKKERDSIHSAIGEYYRAKTDYNKAVRFFTEAGEIETARSLLIDNAEELYQDGRFDLIRKLLSEFPRDMINTDPSLLFYEAVALNMVKPISSREKLLDLQKHFHKAGDYEKEAMIFSVLLTNHFFYQTDRDTQKKVCEAATRFVKKMGSHLSNERRALLEALIPMGQWWTGISKEQAFEEALRAEETSYEMHNEEAFICARLVLAEIYMARGEFIQAQDLISKTGKLMAEQNSGTRVSTYRYLLSFYLADIYFYLGNVSAAVTEIQNVLSNMSRDFAFRPYLEVDLVLYYLYQENIGKAEVLYESLREKEIGENVFLKYFILFQLQMLMAYRNRDTHRTAYYCKRIMEEESRHMLYADYPYSFVSLVEICLYLGNYEQTQALLDDILNEISENDYPYSYATALALYGLLEIRRGDREEANAHFTKMKAVLEKKDFRNLDICDPEVLKEIADNSGLSLFKSFPRLQTENNIEGFSEQEYPLEITTLGDFKVCVEGEEIQINLLSGQRRVMDLLKLLIVFRKNGVMKEKIYDLFWPRYSYKSARDNLNTIIYRLRKTLDDKSDYLYTDVNTIRFKEGVCITDVDKFNTYLDLAKQAETEKNTELALRLYSRAVDLYHGDFLEGELYYDFIRDERENLKNKYRSALFQLAKLSLSSGDHLESLNWSKKIISIDPLCEPAYRLLMIAGALTGNRSEIPRLYDRLNSRLLEYYRVTSDEKTSALKERLIEGVIPDETMWMNEAII